MKARGLGAGIIALILTGPAAVHSEEAFDRLMHAKSLRCKFDQGAAANWDKGRVVLELVKWGEGGAVVFDSIDVKTRKARVIGNIGAGDISVLTTPGLLTFVEYTASGNINVTSVFGRFRTSVDGEFVSVMSRHVDVFGPAPSQYHGICRVSD